MPSHRTSARFPWARLLVPALWAALLAIGGQAPAAAVEPAAPSSAAPAGLSFADAQRLAQARAPALAARQAAFDAATSASLAADQLPDPRLIVGMENLPISGPERYSTTREPMTMKRLGWMQEVPNAAKRRARLDQATALAEQERAQLAIERAAVRRETGLAWLARYYAERRLDLFGALEAENRLLRQTMDARVAAGKAMPADASMARQESLALADRRDELDRERLRATASLRRWVGAAADGPLAGGPPALAPEAAHLLAGIDHHAELGTYGPAGALADAQARELEAAQRGDWSWQLAYGRRGTTYGDMVSVEFSFELPWWSERRQEPQIAAKRLERTRLEAEREDLRRRHAEDIETMLAEHGALDRQLGRARDQAVPLADERARLTLASYEAGRADLGAVLAARREAAEIRLRTLELEAQQMALRLRLATMTTEDLQ